MTPSSLPTNTNSYSVDEGTVSDIQLDSLILSGFIKSLHSRRAAKHLQSLVTQPFLDVRKIRHRQAAINALREDPELQNLVKNLDRFERLLSKFGQQGPRCTISETFSSLTRGSFFSICFRVMMGLLLAQGYWGPAAFMLMYAFSIPAGQMQDSLRLRQQLKGMKDVMNSVGQFADQLTSGESQLLRDYSTTLRQSSLYPSSPAFKQLERILKPSIWTRVLDFCTYYSRFSLSKLTVQVIDRLEADFEDVLKVITDIDILQSNVALLQDGYTMATLLEDGPPRLRIEAGHHPYFFLKDPEHSVANDVSLEISPDSANRFAVLTGPNAGGKSTYLRMIAGNVLLALSGNLVPAVAMELSPMFVLSNMRVMDSVEDSESFFFAQARRIRNLDEASKVHTPCLIIFDEVGTGTGSHEKQALERTIIARLLGREVACLVATHEQSLARLADSTPGMFNLRVASRNAQQYRVLRGIAPCSEAGRVLAEVGLDTEFLELYEQELSNMPAPLDTD